MLTLLPPKIIGLLLFGETNHIGGGLCALKLDSNMLYVFIISIQPLSFMLGSCTTATASKPPRNTTSQPFPLNPNTPPSLTTLLKCHLINPRQQRHLTNPHQQCHLYPLKSVKLTKKENLVPKIRTLLCSVRLAKQYIMYSSLNNSSSWVRAVARNKSNRLSICHKTNSCISSKNYSSRCRVRETVTQMMLEMWVRV